MPKQSQAWKDLERYVAKYFNGKRIPRGSDFSQSLPDVVAPSPYWPGGTIVVECKYSQSQPWVDYLMRVASELDPDGIDRSTHTMCIQLDGFVFWDLEASKGLGSRQTAFIADLSKTSSKRAIPGYIKDNYKQCVEYIANNQMPTTICYPGPYLPIVVLGKKRCPVRIAYTRLKDYKDYFGMKAK